MLCVDLMGRILIIFLISKDIDHLFLHCGVAPGLGVFILSFGSYLGDAEGARPAHYLVWTVW